MTRYHGNGEVVCMWEQLTELSTVQVMPGISTQSGRGEEEVSRMQRERRRRFRLFLPLIVMENVMSLTDKMDELKALMKTEQKF